MKHAEFFNIPAIKFGRKRLRNHNALVRLFDGTTGMKTGYVCASGFNVAVRTTRDNRTIIAIVFGEKSSFSRNIKAAKLLKNAFESNRLNKPDFATFEDKSFNSKEPYDITKEVCPRKYAALGRPKVRPPDAPSPQDFDGIDTQIVSEKSAEEGAEKAIEVSALSLKEQSKLYFQPAANLRDDVRIQLGGGDGPNPFGIKHTQGDVYQPPIPVPIKRPALDLAVPKE